VLNTKVDFVNALNEAEISEVIKRLEESVEGVQMIEITNMQKSPIQLVIKSRRALHSYDTVDIPGSRQRAK